jgi:hypothetical protein
MASNAPYSGKSLSFLEKLLQMLSQQSFKCRFCTGEVAFIQGQLQNLEEVLNFVMCHAWAQFGQVGEGTQLPLT